MSEANEQWVDCPFRDRVSRAIDIYRAYHIGYDKFVVMFVKPGVQRHVQVLHETIGDNPSDEVLNQIQGWCLDGVPFERYR